MKRLVRSKKFDNLKEGDALYVKKITAAEFILRVKSEMPLLFTEAVSQCSYEKFADMLEMINGVCDILEMDWYECTKVKSQKRWDEGKYDCFMVVEEIDQGD